jgi:hypothetical protein
MASVPVPAWLPTKILMGLLGQLAVCANGADAKDSTKTKLHPVQALRKVENIRISCIFVGVIFFEPSVSSCVAKTVWGETLPEREK